MLRWFSVSPSSSKIAQICRVKYGLQSNQKNDIQLGYERCLVLTTPQKPEWTVLPHLKLNYQKYEPSMNWLWLSFWKMKEAEHLSFPTFSSCFIYSLYSLRTMKHILHHVRMIPLFWHSGIGINNLKQKNVLSATRLFSHIYFHDLFNRAGFSSHCAAVCMRFRSSWKKQAEEPKKQELTTQKWEKKSEKEIWRMPEERIYTM